MAHPERFDELLASLGSPRTSSDRRLPPRGPEELPVITDHELLRCIGQGSYGEVWLARSVLGTCRAVKIVFRDSFNSDQPYEREFRGIQRFEPISRTNDGLMDILHVGRNDAQRCFYYVMELADDAAADSAPGSESSRLAYVPRTLQFDLKQQHRLPGAECVQLGIALTSALGHLHRHGLIHRDIKPSNIIFVQGVPKLADIGLVVEVEEAVSFVGTEGYIPPEGPTSPQADLFSLGKVLYEASNGKDRKEYPEPMTGLCDLPDRAEQELLLELNAVILKACAQDVRERYQTAEEFHADLALVQSGKSVRRRRRLETRVAMLTRVALAVGLVAVIGFAGYLFQKRQTAIAQRLSQENRQLAEGEALQRGRAENALLDVQLQRAHEMLAQRNYAAALAQLGQLLRLHPANRFIAEQIVATLSAGNFPLPIARLSEGNELLRARFSSDGSCIVTISTNGAVGVLDARSAHSHFTIPIAQSTGGPVEISPDAELVAVAAQGEVRVASTRTGEVKATLPEEGHISRLGFNADGSRLLIAKGNELSVREVQTGELLIGPLKHQSNIDSARFSGAGDRIITFSKEESTARVWEVQTGIVISEFVHRSSKASWISPTLSSDGRRVVTLLSGGNMGGTVARIWNATTGEALSDPIDCKFPIKVLVFSPDGAKLLIGGNGRLAWICDGQTGRRMAGPIEYDEAISAGAFSLNGQKAVAASGTGLVRIWDGATGKMLANFDSRSEWIHSLEFSPDGDQLLVCSGGGAWLWDVQDGAARSLVLPHDEAVTFAQFSADGKRVVTTMDERVSTTHWSRPLKGRSALLWDAHSRKQLTPRLLHERGVISAAFSPDAKRVATTSWDHTAKLWSSETGEALSEPLVHPGAVRLAIFSADSTQLWTSSWRHSAWLWHVESGQLIRDLLKNEGVLSDFEHFPIRTDDLSADGKWLLTCGAPGQEGTTNLSGAQVWNARTGERRYVPASPPRSPWDANIRTARFSPDGQRFVTSSYYGATICDARNGDLLIGPIEHKGRASIHSAEFSADGTKVVTAGNDGTACMWNSHTGQLIGRPMAHKGEVVHAAFSPDGKRVVTASWWDNAAFLWDAETGFQIGQALQHEDWVTFAAFSPDGQRVITTSVDQAARIWEVPLVTLPVPEWLADLAEAVGGQQSDSTALNRPVPLDRLLELKRRLKSNTETNYYARFAEWFFADRSTRPISVRSVKP